MKSLHLKNRGIILSEAKNIAEDLILKADFGKNNMSWKTLKINQDKSYFYDKNETLYTGVSGISLFFLEFYKTTGDLKYLETAKLSSNWIEDYCHDNPDDPFFITGRLSTVHLHLKFFEYTNERIYLNKAVQTAKKLILPLTLDTCLIEYLNGIVGTLFVLLELHSVINEKWILKKVDFFLKYILENSFYSSKGLYWDYLPQYTQPLCGFSHGCSGVGFLFIQLGNYFKNNAFYYIAEQAFLYESQFYSRKYNNWLDLRKGFENSDLDAWCHGAVGIGLARIEYCKIKKEKKIVMDLNHAIAKSINTSQIDNPYDSFSLCHGLGGNADLLIETFKLTGKTSYLRQAENLALRAAMYKTENNFYLSGYTAANKIEDLSLFMGNAGIGYFLLRVLFPHKVPTVLAPHIKSRSLNVNCYKSNFYSINISLRDLRLQLLKNIYKETISSADKIIPNFKKYFSEKINYTHLEAKQFEKYMNKVLSENKNLKFISEKYKLEKKVFNFKMNSYKLFKIDEDLNRDKLLKYSEMNLNEQTGQNIKVTKNIKLLKICDYGQQNKVLKSKKNKYILLFLKSNEVEKINLTPLSYEIIKNFKFLNTIEIVIDSIIQSTKTKDDKEMLMIRNIVKLQVDELLKKNILYLI